MVQALGDRAWPTVWIVVSRLHCSRFQHQLAGRLLNFGPPPGDGIEPLRQQYARDFEEKALGVLRFCDPESSRLAWFTWHATQCHVAIIRVSRLCPWSQISRNSNDGSRRPMNDSKLLRTILRVLEKTQLMHTDVRGEAFRWYATIPWPMLATAVLECASCTDVDLVRRGWPVLEWWCGQHEALVAQHGEDPSQGVLASAMQRASANIAVPSPLQCTPKLDSNSADVATSTQTINARSLDEWSSHANTISPVVQRSLQSNLPAFDLTFDLALPAFDPLPWLPDSTMDDLSAWSSISHDAFYTIAEPDPYFVGVLF
jgi:hypothetical protein